MAALESVLRAFAEERIAACVGGSALLASLGLVEVVHDWDVTTDAGVEAVERALRRTGLPIEDRTSSGRYASRARFVVDDSVDVIVGFALRDGDDVVELPSRPTSTWRGLPMADPVVWEEAYRLLGRSERAALLRDARHVAGHHGAVSTSDDVVIAWSETGSLDDEISFDCWGQGTPRLRPRDPDLPYFDDAVVAAAYLMQHPRAEIQLTSSAARELMPDLPL